jgi:hypothetical protein
MCPVLKLKGESSVVDIQAYSREIVSLLVPVITTVVTWLFQARARIKWSVHSHKMFLTEQNVTLPDGTTQAKPGSIRVMSLFVVNTGRQTAEDVEVVFNWSPQLHHLWPQRQYSHAINPDGRFILSLPSLGAKEFVGVEALTIDRPEVIQVRSKQGPGKNIMMGPQKIFPTWVRVVVLYLLFMGLAASVYLLFAVIQFGLNRPG